MTAEEIDIIVEASVEQAVKEFKKLLPAIKKQLSGIQKEFDKVNIKEITANIDMSQVTKKIKQAKKQIKDTFNPNDISGMTIDGKAFKIENIKGYSKEVQKLKGQIGTLSRFKTDNSQIETPQIKNTKVQTPKTENTGQANQYSIWTNILRKYYAMLDMAKAKMYQLRQETDQTGISQNRWTIFFSGLKGKMQQVNSMAQSIRNVFSKMPNVTKMVTNNIKKMGTGIKSGLGHVLKYAGALIGLRSIYNTLQNSASSWLSSSNTLAKQLSANIEYLRYSLGSVFSSLLQYLINLAYQLMKAIQSVVYAFSGINIFAKATASSMNKTAGSAKKASNSLSSVHSDISNVSEKDSGGGGAVSPSMDLSQLDSQMSPFAQKLHDFFKPLVDSWNTYGTGLIEQVKVTASQIGGLIASVWGSFENIITNGTVYSILENILAIIGNIAEAFSNAWNYNGNGDAIVQNLANAFNKLLDAINNVVKSDGFQWWLKWCSDKFKDISEKLGSIDWQPLINALETIGKSVGSIALEILNGLTDVFKWLVENPIVAEILIAIGIAIGVVATAISIATSVAGFFIIAMEILKIELLPLIGIIAGIIAIVALVVLAIMNWDSIMNWLKQTVEVVINAVVEFFTNLWNQVSFIFEAIWNVISTILGFIWDLISTVFQAIWNIVSPILEAIWQIISTVFQAVWNIISTILGSVWNVFSQIFGWIWELTSKVFQGIWNVISPIMNTIWNGIKSVLSKIKEVWSNIWNGVANVIRSVWNGIWGCIKGVINSILGGIENMVNGVVRGFNWMLGGISNVANAIGGIAGMKPIDLRLNYVSLPRLAKGNVAYSPLIAQFGEYSGASHNPEITAPQNILRETFDDVLSNHEWNNSNNSSPIQLTVQVGNKKIGEILLENLRDMKRQTGKDIEVLVGG